MVPLFQAQFARLRLSVPIFRSAEALASPGRATQRVKDMLDLHEFWLVEADGILDRWRQRCCRSCRAGCGQHDGSLGVLSGGLRAAAEPAADGVVVEPVASSPRRVDRS